MHGPFLNQDAGKVRKMLHLNITGLTHLTHEIALGMVSRRDGHILLVASILGYQAVPDFASYAASKAYVLHFGEALHNELKPHGVNVTVLSPGFSLTSFAKNAEQKVTPVLGMMAMAPETVVDIGMKAMLKGRAGVIAGLPNVLAAFSNRFAPRSLQRWIMRRIVSG
jgi:short-subunit dehydrogenase